MIKTVLDYFLKKNGKTFLMESIEKVKKKKTGKSRFIQRS